jgi:hypothetical protein
MAKSFAEIKTVAEFNRVIKSRTDDTPLTLGLLVEGKWKTLPSIIVNAKTPDKPGKMVNSAHGKDFIYATVAGSYTKLFKVQGDNLVEALDSDIPKAKEDLKAQLQKASTNQGPGKTKEELPEAIVALQATIDGLKLDQLRTQLEDLRKKASAEGYKISPDFHVFKARKERKPR